MLDWDDIQCLQLAFEKRYITQEHLQNTLARLEQYKRQGKKMRAIELLAYMAQNGETPALNQQQIAALAIACNEKKTAINKPVTDEVTIVLDETPPLIANSPEQNDSQPQFIHPDGGYADITTIDSAEMTVAYSEETVADPNIVDPGEMTVAYSEETAADPNIVEPGEMTVAYSEQTAAKMEFLPDAISAEMTAVVNYEEDNEHRESGLGYGVDSSELTAVISDTTARTDSPEKERITRSHSSLRIEKMLEGFGHYTIEKEIGQGGMGVVYKAYDQKLQRPVALKVLKSDEVTDLHLQRFIREARSVAQLKHTNIISVYDVGETPLPYFTMDYIEGENLSYLIKEGEIKPLQAAKIIKKVADALHIVHQHDIIHRDIKPSNIMIDQKGEPKLMDFGLAKTQDTNLSRSGDFLGTPAYMSPEQVNKETADARSDIYSLGASLYQALTGRSPFQGDTIYNIILQICNSEPVAPRMLNPDINPDLEAICLKCMEKSPSKRYSSSRMLARDLQNFIEQRPVMAKPSTKYTLVKRWIQRNKAISFLTASFFVIAAISILLFVLHQDKINKDLKKGKNVLRRLVKVLNKSKNEVTQNNIKLMNSERELSNALREAQIAKQKTIAKTREAEQQMYYVRLNLADRYIMDPNLSLAESTLKACPPKMRHWEWYWLNHKLHTKNVSIKLPQLEENSHPSLNHLKKIYFDAKTNKYIILSDEGYGDARYTRSLLSYDLDSKQYQNLYQTKDYSDLFFISPQNNLIASLDDANKTITVVDYARNQKIFHYKFSNIVTSFSINPAGSILAVAVGYSRKKHSLSLWSLKTKKRLKAKTTSESRISYSCFSPDGKILAYASRKRGDLTHNFYTLNIWHWSSGKKAKEIMAHSDRIAECNFNPSGTIIVTAGKDNIAKLWQVSNGENIATLYGHSSSIYRGVFSPDGKILATASRDLSIRLWDAKTGKHLQTLLGHKGHVLTCAFSGDGKFLFSGDADGNFKIWDIHFGSKPITIRDQYGIERCGFGINNKLFLFDTFLYKKFIENPEYILRREFATHGLGKWLGDKIKINQEKPGKWLIETDNSLFVAEQNKTKITLYQKFFYSAETTGFKLRSLPSGKKIKNLILYRATACDFTPDSRKAIIGARNGKVGVWDIVKGKKLSFVDADDKWISDCAISTDGTLVATVSRFESEERKKPDAKTSIKLWRLKNDTLQLLWKDEFHFTLYSCDFSPDGRYVAAGGIDGRARIWQTKNGKQIHVFEHKAAVRDVKFFPGREKYYLATTGDDAQVHLWSLEKGRIAVFAGHSEQIYSCAFSPDGKRLVSAANDNTIRLWDVHAAFVSSVGKDKALLYSPILTLKAHNNGAKNCSFSPDGKFIVTSGDDDTIKIWQAKGLEIENE